jgi:hypothetical protein
VGTASGRFRKIALVSVEPESKPARPHHPIAHLVFGVGGGIAGTVYGTVVVMATLTAAYATEKDPWQLAVLVFSTALVLWIAHLYAHGLAESITKNRRLRRGDVKSIAYRELGILLAALPPVAMLILGAVDLLSWDTSVWLALGVGLLILAVEGLRYARLEHLGLGATLVSVGGNLALGLLVVALKVGLQH